MKTITPILKIKLILIIIIVSFIALFVYQNFAVFTHPFNLRLNIWIKQYELPGVQSCLIFLTFFLLGFLLAYFIGLGERLRIRRSLKVNLEKVKRMKQMEEQLDSLRRQSAPSKSAAFEYVSSEEISREDSDSEEDSQEEEASDKTSDVS